MNSSVFFPNFWRFVTLVAIQTIIMSEVALSVDGYFNILVYPLFILFLPIELATPIAVLLGFTVGLSVDAFSATLGVNASAGALSGYARAYILYKAAPKGGFSGKEPIPSPFYFGWRWFSGVAASFFAVHILWYFSMAYFTPVYIVEKILPQALLSWMLSMIVALVLTRLFYPKS